MSCCPDKRIFPTQAKYFFPLTTVPIKPITRIPIATGMDEPVLGEAEMPVTPSFTTANGERPAVENVTDPFAMLVGIMVSHTLPV